MPDILYIISGAVGYIILVLLILFMLLATAAFSLPYTEDDEYFEN